MKHLVPLALALSLLLPAVTLASDFDGRPAEDALPLPAFPGAEGYGALAKGGRGGRVIEVTNLDDSGPGSLRACAAATGPRICVFRVAGTITLLSRLSFNSFLTIAGQTAPGEGITLKAGPNLTSGMVTIPKGAHDIVVRYIRSRPGPPRDGSGKLIMGETLYAFEVNGDHLMFDHVSASWSAEETFTIWYPEAHDITLQWSIIAEGLRNSTHPEGRHSKGILVGSGGNCCISIHHNVIAHHDDRFPEIKLGTNKIGDIINNVIYDWGDPTIATSRVSLVSDEYGQTHLNVIGNYYKPGPSSVSSLPELVYYNASGLGVRLFLDGNFSTSGFDYSGPSSYLVRSRFSSPPITTQTCISDSDCQSRDQVLARAGANFPYRDPVDARVVNDVRNGTGRIIDDPAEVGGWPALSNGTPPVDTDHDGMPDEWERRQALNPSDPGDGSQDADGDGYTNVEEYLNELAGDQAPPTSGCSLFVAANGSDANDGRSEANSLQSIRRAAEVVQPGEVVCVKRGTYAGFGIVNKRGTPADPIVFKPYPGDEGQVIVDGKAPSWTVVVQFIEAEYVELQGFLITDSSRTVTKGIEICCNSTHLRIVGNTIYDLHRANAVNGAGSYHEFLGNHIYGIEHGYGLYLNGSDYRISGNRIHDVDGYAMHLYPSCTRFVVEDNVVYDNGRPDFDWNGTPRRMGDGILIYGSDNVVQNNVSYGNMDWGVRVRGARVVNNTVYGNGLQGIYAYDNTSSIVRNNLSYANRGEEGYPGQAYVGAGNVADHNSWDLDLGDPQFADPGAGDFHLAPSSPAVDVGSLEGAPAQDFEGDARPMGVGIDLGADEVGAGGPSFADVPASHWAYADIEKLYRGGYVVGCQATPERKYCPEATLSRAEAAVFVVRGHHTASFLPPEPNPSDLHFADVARGTWYAKWVEQLWQDGFSAGCASDPLRFCPDVPHTRAEATVFFVRMLKGKDYLPGEPASLPYADVAPGTWYRKWVAAAYDAGLTRDCEDPPNRGDDRFRPEESITRAEAACMMVKAKDLPPPTPTPSFTPSSTATPIFTATPGSTPTPTSTAAPGAACTLYIATVGDDAADGKSVGTAFRTLQRAADVVTPGSVICVRRGSYVGFQFIQKGNQQDARYVLFQPYPGDEGQVTIDGMGSNFIFSTSAIQIGYAHHLEINGFIITDSAKQPIHINGRDYYYGAIGICCDSSHVRIVNNTIHSIEGNAVMAAGASHELLDNHIYDIGKVSKDAYATYMSGSDYLIRGNVIHDAAGYGILGYPSAEGFIVENNTVFRNGSLTFPWPTGKRREGDGILLYGRSSLRNNVVYDNVQWGIRVRGALVVNNTVYGNGLQGIYAYDNTDSTLVNNISYANRGEDGYPGDIYFGPGNASCSHNLFARQTGSGTCTDTVGEDPQLVDAQAGDFHLRATSPAIDAGTLQDAPTADFEGDPRPQGSRVDLGADEARR